MSVIRAAARRAAWLVGWRRARRALELEYRLVGITLAMARGMVKRLACDIAVLTLEGPMTAPIEDVRRPSRLTWRAEWPRSTAGLGQFWATFPLLVAGPRGDGHEVLVLPGLLADDAFTGSLRALLGRRLTPGALDDPAQPRTHAACAGGRAAVIMDRLSLPESGWRPYRSGRSDGTP